MNEIVIISESRFIKAKIGLWFAFSTLIMIGLYLFPLLDFASKSRLFWYIAGLSFISCLCMFLWRVSVGETGHLTCFGFDTKIRCGSGIYLMPALLPFLRGIDLVFGFAVEVPSQQHEGNTTNIRHFSDQRTASYRVNTHTNFLLMLLGQLFSNLILFLLDLRSADGKVKYYKIGGIGYAVAWGMAFATQ